MKISIIIPIYNGEKFISKCIDSILKQTYKHFEIICINDGSKDASLKILKEYEKKDKRIRVFDQSNSGIAKTRNRGIEKATGEYIMFIDNDDYIDETYVETYVNNIENGKYDMVIGGYKRINNQNKVLINQTLNPKSKWSKYIVTAPWAKIYRKSFILDNKITFLNYIGEDIYFNLKCYNNAKIKIIKNTGYTWFYNDESFSNKNKSKETKEDLDIIKLFEYLKEVVKIENPYIKYFFKRYVVWYLIYMSESSNKSEIEKEYDLLTTWLKNNNITKTIHPFSPKLNGEKIKNRLAVFLYNILSKKTFINLISRG